ncbi:MAG: hypothetical protein LBN18_06475 [Dysgonamonadaceae bacterium]|nr:hypothetical protein [Dysgonamonadaceae bacterium]
MKTKICCLYMLVLFSIQITQLQAGIKQNNIGLYSNKKDYRTVFVQDEHAGLYNGKSPAEQEDELLPTLRAGGTEGGGDADKVGQEVPAGDGLLVILIGIVFYVFNKKRRILTF